MKDFRVDFRVEGERVEVFGVRTGYRPAELASSAPELHRELTRRFGPPDA